MQIYVALVSLQSTLDKNYIALHEVPSYVCKYGFSGIEILDRQLTSTDHRQLEVLKQRCEKHSCGVVVDAGCDLTYPTSAQREAEIRHLKQVIAKAVLLDCSVVRITLGGQTISAQKIFRRMRSRQVGAGQPGTVKKALSAAWTRRAGYRCRSFLANYLTLNEKKLGYAIDTLNSVLPFAADRDISLAIENHWGISSRPEWIMRVIDAINSPRVGTCLDFGNFPTRIDRYKALLELAPKALHVQAKCWHFDANGEESKIDYRRCMKVLRNMGYSGPVAIEYEGSGNEIDACIKARDLILQYA